MIDQQQRQHPTIRRARPAEASDLSALAFRSKAHWGYDADFLEACREDLTLSAGDIEACQVYVLEAQGRLAGFYRLQAGDAAAELVDLFVEPGAIGHGHGKRLWQHALAIAERSGFECVVLQSDPHAEGFYRAMGARRVGTTPSTVFPGRVLPLMALTLAEAGSGAGGVGLARPRRGSRGRTGGQRGAIPDVAPPEHR